MDPQKSSVDPGWDHCPRLKKNNWEHWSLNFCGQRDVTGWYWWRHQDL